MDFSLNRSFVLILLIQYIAHYCVKPGLHIVGRIVSIWICLQPYPKENITALQVSIAKISCEDCYYQKHALPREKTASQLLLLSSLRVWSMDCCLRSPALSQVYLSLTFQLSLTAVVNVEMSSTFPTVPVKLNNSQLWFFNEKFTSAMSHKGVRNCFATSL